MMVVVVAAAVYRKYLISGCYLPVLYCDSVPGQTMWTFFVYEVALKETFLRVRQRFLVNISLPVLLSRIN